MIDSLKDRVVTATSSLFSHGTPPLRDTLDFAPDPGLLGPESVSWRVIGDAAAFVGGIRALLIQAAHPEVVSGVETHSRYRSDPLGRLTRTSAYVTAVTYGATPEVSAAVGQVRRAHRPIKGVSARANAYSADDPELAAWVHNVLTDSFLAAFQSYGPQALSATDADRFVAEQARCGALLGASPLPTSADELARWVSEHPDVAPSDDQARAGKFLRNPPLPIPIRVGYRLLYEAAVATIPPRIAAVIGSRAMPGGRAFGRGSVASLRWMLGSSPSWHLALVRTGSPVPEGLFRQPLPARVPIHSGALGVTPS